MGNFLMYLAFFVALFAMGLMIVETDFGSRHTDFFSFSTYLAFFSFLLFIIGETLERRKKRWGTGVNSPGVGTNSRRGLRTNVRTATILLLNLKALFLLRKLGAKRFY